MDYFIRRILRNEDTPSDVDPSGGPNCEPRIGATSSPHSSQKCQEEPAPTRDWLRTAQARREPA
jgi:hypothetical protein